MPLNDDQQAQISQAFIQIARQYELPNVDAQSLSMAFMSDVEDLEEGQPVDLQNLFNFLVNDKRLSPLEVVDFCIVLESRQDKIGVTFQMPLQAKDVTPDRVTRVVEQFNKKTAPNVAEAPSPQAPAQAGPAGEPWVPPPKPKGGARMSLWAALALSAVAGGGHFAYRQSGASAALKEVSTQGMLGGLPCTRLLANTETAVCDIASSAWSGAQEPTLRAQARRLKESLSSRGVTSLYVRLSAEGKPEHGKIVIRVP